MIGVEVSIPKILIDVIKSYNIILPTGSTPQPSVPTLESYIKAMIQNGPVILHNKQRRKRKKQL